MAKTTKATKKAAAPKEAEVEEVELEELDEETEATDTKPKKSDDEVVFGASDLAKLANEKFGTKYDARAVRTLLRKMAREDKPRVDREIKADNRSRYSWSGPNDPEVVTVLAAIEAGEIEAGRKEALDKLKEQGEKKKKAKQAAKAEKGSKGKKGKKDDTDGEEEIDLDEED